MHDRSAPAPPGKTPFALRARHAGMVAAGVALALLAVGMQPPAADEHLVRETGSLTVPAPPVAEAWTSAPSPLPSPAPPPVVAPDVVAVPEDAGAEVPQAVIDRVISAAPDVLVVLGAKVHGGRPGWHLTQRLRTALRLYTALGRRPSLLLTGGHGEAEAMRDFLLARGVPRRQLILENRSRNTVQNACFAMAILERRAPGVRVALLVTTAVRRRGGRVDDHALRALASFTRYAHHVRVGAVSVNRDPALAPRVYLAAPEHLHTHHARSSRS